MALYVPIRLLRDNNKIKIAFPYLIQLIFCSFYSYTTNKLTFLPSYSQRFLFDELWCINWVFYQVIQNDSFLMNNDAICMCIYFIKLNGHLNAGGGMISAMAYKLDMETSKYEGGY